MGTQIVATRAVVTRKAFDVLMAVKMDVLALAAVEAPEADAVPNTIPATAAGAANAPMAAARVTVKMAVGAVRRRVVSILAAIRSRSSSRPRARRCLRASALIPSRS